MKITDELFKHQAGNAEELGSLAIATGDRKYWQRELQSLQPVDHHGSHGSHDSHTDTHIDK